MLPIAHDRDRRLTAVLPSLLASLDDAQTAGVGRRTDRINRVDRVVLIVVDGLGWANLKQRKAHARFLTKCPSQRIETVVPSTTGAALSSLLTGVAPGEHGLLGYRQWDENSQAVRFTLTDWGDPEKDRSWMTATPLTAHARADGLNPVAIGRAAHAHSGYTRALLAGTRYLAAATMAERFESTATTLMAGDSRLTYVYIDELDRAGHVHGWQSEQWLHALEELDAQVERFANGLPEDVVCVLTADHGMVDVPSHRHVLMDAHPELLENVRHIGGEPRFRHLYLDEEASHADCEVLAQSWRNREGNRSLIVTRQEAVEMRLFGDVGEALRSRVGHVVVAARKNVAYYTSDASDAASRRMIGQHGGVSEDEMGVPLIELRRTHEPSTR